MRKTSTLSFLFTGLLFLLGAGVVNAQSNCLPNTISATGPQDFCTGGGWSDPVTINGSAPSCGNATFQWQILPHGQVTWSNAPGTSTGQNYTYTFGFGSDQTYGFRRVVTCRTGSCTTGGTTSHTSAELYYSTYPAIDNYDIVYFGITAPNSVPVADDFKGCDSYDPTTITGGTPSSSSGTGTFTFLWQYRDSVGTSAWSSWKTVPGTSTSNNYDGPDFANAAWGADAYQTGDTLLREIRRVTYSGDCEAYSGAITIAVYPKPPAAPSVSPNPGRDCGRVFYTAVPNNSSHTAYWYYNGVGADLQGIGTSWTDILVGTKNVYVTEVNTDYGCESDAYTTLVSTVDPTIDLTADTSWTTCYQGNDGSATFTIFGGTAPFEYQWSTGGSGTTTDTFFTKSDFEAGLYTVTVTDNTGCANDVSFNIDEPAQISLSATLTDPLCNSANGSPSGSIALSPTNYTSYAWSNGQTASTASNLSGGTYTVTVTSSLGCQRIESYTLTEPNAINPQAIVSYNCGATSYTSATITVLTSGGTGTVQYSFDGGSTFQTGNAKTFSGASSNKTYNIVVKDDNNCQGTATATVSLIGSSAVSGSDHCDLIYVSPTGSSSGTFGTPDCPVSLLQAFNIYNATPSRNHIIMLAGTYNFTSTISLTSAHSGLWIDGGYAVSGTDWVKTSTQVTRLVINPSSYETQSSAVQHKVGIKINGANNIKLQDLQVDAVLGGVSGQTSSGYGRSVYGIYIANTSGYELLRVEVNTGAASNGKNGSAGSAGINGSGGGFGGLGHCDAECPNFGNAVPPHPGYPIGGVGGAGGSGTGGGSAGAFNCRSTPGVGGSASSTNSTWRAGGGGGGGGGGGSEEREGARGGNGGPRGGNGGGAGGYGTGGPRDRTADCSTFGDTYNGDDGVAGSNGLSGANGGNGSAVAGGHSVFGSFAYYAPAKANSGVDGQGGAGGGGGGGGAGQGEDGACVPVVDGSGGGGGGGGGGGAGGTGGEGGYGGGSSIAVYRYNSSGAITEVDLSAGAAGSGGSGGSGGFGGFGGAGGKGGASSGFTVYCIGPFCLTFNCSSSQTGNGANGGNGGNGGRGGTGGTGDAGDSFELYTYGSGSSNLANNIPRTHTITVNQKKGCTNSEIVLTKNTGTWGLSSMGSPSFVNNTGPSSTSYNSGSSPLSVYYTSVAGTRNAVVSGVTYRDFIDITSSRVLPSIVVKQNGVTTTTVCADQQVDFSVDWSATTEPSAYEWEIVSGTTPDGGANGATTFHTFTYSASPYYVKLKVYDDCCGWSIPIYQAIIMDDVPQGTASLTSSTGSFEYCEGTSATLTVSGITNADTYTWSVPSSYITMNSANGTSSTTMNMTFHTYPGVGNNPLTVSVYGTNGCGDGITHSFPVVFINDLPNVAVTGTTYICTGSTTQLTAAVTNSAASPGPYAYNWSTGAMTQQITTGTAGAYSVTVTDGNGCTGTQSATVTVETNLSDGGTAGPDATICYLYGGTITLSGHVGDVIRWESSTDQVNWDTINNTTTTLNYSNLTQTTYYRAVVQSGPCAPATSNIVTIEVLASNVKIWYGTVNTNWHVAGNWCGGIPTLADSVLIPAGPTWNSIPIPNQPTIFADKIGLAGKIRILEQAEVTVSASGRLCVNQECASANAGPDQEICNGESATLSATGGDTYEWSTTETTQSITVSPTTTTDYTVTVTVSASGNSDVDTVRVVVNQLPTPSLSVTSNYNGQHLSCNGATDGAVTANVSAGAAPYSYAWSTGATTQSISGLGAGTYSVTVTDAKGCVDNGSITVVAPPAVSASAAVTSNHNGQDISCVSASDGAATVTPSGGTPGYTYQWDVNTGNQTSQTANNLSDGTYSVTVTDANGCSVATNVTLNDPPALSATAAVSSNFNGADVSCNGATDGAATATPAGGTSPYTYQWSANAANQTTQTATGLGADTYGVTVTDANGCVTSASVTLTEPAVVTTSAVVASNYNGEDISCNGGSDGAVQAVPSGGTTPYSYQWSANAGGAASALVTGLPIGTYNVTVTDANGCSATAAATLTEPAALSASASVSSNYNGQDISCNGGSDGEATASGSGGTGAYTYKWSDVSGQTTQTATGLSAGAYTVTITDANGCEETATVSLSEPTALSSSTSVTSNYNGADVSCSGAADGAASVSSSGGIGAHTYVWSNGDTGASGDNLPAGTHSVTVTDANGCTLVDNVTLTEPNTLSTTAAVYSDYNGADVSCNGASDGAALVSASNGTPPYTYVWSNGISNDTITGVAAGSYTVTVTDANGCSVMDNVTVTQPTAIGASALVVSNYNGAQISCNGASDGEALATGSGGTPPYGFAWSNGDNTATADNLAAGPYTVTVTDANGCSTTASATVVEPALLVANAGADQTICNGTSATLDASGTTGGNGGNTYLWSTGATTASISVSPSSNTVYSVTVTDNNGCTSSDDVQVFIDVAVTVEAGSNATICETGTYTTSGASISGGITTGTWTSSGDGTWTNPASINGAVYTPGTNDISGTNTTVTLTLTSDDPAGPCPAVSDVIQLTINDEVFVDAGANATICEDATYTTTGASVSGGTTAGTWTSSGDGTWTNPTSVNGAVYAPGANDISGTNTTVTLTLTSDDPAGPCPAVADVIQLTMNDAVTVEAGVNATICEDATYTTTGASISGGITTGIWTSSGDGSWTNPTSINGAVYTPGTNDISGTNTTVTLTLTSDDPTGPCGAVADVIQLTMNDAVTVEAGVDATICEDATYTTTGASISGGITTGTWTSSGDGSWTNATTINGAVYTPGANDISGANTTVTLTLTSDDPAGPCGVVADVIQLTMNDAVTVDAGADATICEDATYTTTGASISGGITTGTWTSSGDGSWTNPTSVNGAVYTPGANDISGANTTVTLTLTSDDPAGPCGVVADVIQLTMNDAVMVEAGANATICETGSYTTTGASISGGITTGTWTSSGTGSWTNATTINGAVYTPSAADISAGSVTLTLTSDDPAGPCGVVADNMTLSIDLEPTTANAGSDQNVSSTSTTLAGNTPTTGSGLWTIQSGTGGSFGGSSTSTNPTATFSGVSGNIYVLRWTISNGVCADSYDEVTITFASGYDTGNEAYWTEKDLGWNTVTIGGGTVQYNWDATNKFYISADDSVLIPNKDGSPDGLAVHKDYLYGFGASGSASSSNFQWDAQAIAGAAQGSGYDAKYDVTNVFVSPVSGSAMTYCAAMEDGYGGTCDNTNPGDEITINTPDATLAWPNENPKNGDYFVKNGAEQINAGVLKSSTTNDQYVSQQQLDTGTVQTYCVQTYGVGWRMPTDIEAGHHDDAVFTGGDLDLGYESTTTTDYMWTSSRYQTIANYRWRVQLNTTNGNWGIGANHLISNTYKVRCIYVGNQ